MRPILDTLCDLIVDCEHKTAPPAEDGEYPLIRTPDIGVGRLLVEKAQRVTAETYRAWTKRAVPRPGDLILAREAPVGNVGIVRDRMEPVLGQRTVLIRPDASRLDPCYLNYLLSGPALRGWMEGVSIGATVPHLNMADIRSMELPPLPPLPTQRKIAGILCAYDDLIENNNRRIETLEEMAQRIYREWFIDFRYPGHTEEPLVDSELGPIPALWTPARTSELISRRSLAIGDGYRAKNAELGDDGLPFVRIGDLRDDFRFDGVDRLMRASLVTAGAKVSREGDCVVSTKGTVGRVLFVPSYASAFVYSPQLSYWRVLDDSIVREYLICWMRGPDFVRQCTNVKGATDMADYVNLKDQRQMLILLPPARLQQAFRGTVRPILDQIANLRRVNGTLHEVRDRLLPPLIAGDIRVDKLNIAFPDAA